MTITFSDAGKRFNREWIFRNFSYRFVQGERYAITGPNGSGKSTLLQVIAGSMAASTGHVAWTVGDKNVDTEEVFVQLAICAPYLDVIEEMTATEFLEFHSRFKPLLAGITVKEALSLVGLEKSAHKQIRYYSSGMKQRIKLAQAIFSDVPLLLLDEPCTNLDAAGTQLYLHLVQEYTAGKTIVVSSNDAVEYSYCPHQVSILDFK